MRILLILCPFFAAIGGLAFVLTQLADQAGLVPQATIAATTNENLELSQITPVSASIAAPETATAPEDATMRNLTASVLASLGQPAGPAVAPSTSADASDEMKTMTSQVLAALSNKPSPEQPEKQVTLANLIHRAMQEGKSDSYINTLVNEAADTGQIRVPAALRNSDGRVDTATLIAALAQAASGASDDNTARVVLPSGEGVEVRLVAESNGKMVPYYFYTVQPGDSLGAIALNFYGDAAEYRRIFTANRRLLSSPDRIREGQRLRIPALL